MNNRLALTVLLAFLLAVPGTAADPPSEVRSVVLDQFQTVDLSQIVFTTGAGGLFEPVTGGFRFRESQMAGQTSPVDAFPDGFYVQGSGMATLQVEGPGAYDHMHVRFDADRRVAQFEAGGNDLNPAGQAFSQELVLANATGQIPPVRSEYFLPSDLSTPVVRHDVRSSASPGTDFAVIWSFADEGVDAVGNVGVLYPSGEDYAADITDIEVEFSGVPHPYDLSTHPDRHGTVFLSHTYVDIDMTGVTDADVRVEVANSLTFAWVEAPDGARIMQPTTRNGTLPTSWNRDFVLVENAQPDVAWITVPKEFVAAHGNGTYTVAFTSVDTVEAQPLLIPIAILVLLLPLPFAILADRKVRHFEREAFGAYKRSARKLRIALFVAVLYYATVVAASFIGKGFTLLVVWPLALLGFVTYAQVVVAIAAFVALYGVARELDSITRPREDGTP